MHLSFLRKPHLLLPAALFLLTPAVAVPPDPDWWGEPHSTNPADPSAVELPPAVIESLRNINNKGPANIGQVKHMARSALLALRASGQTQMADGIEAALVGPPVVGNPALSPPISSWDPPTTPAEQEKQKAPLLLGQLKAIAHPFYNRLNATASIWVLEQIQLNHNRPPDAPPVAGTDYWHITGNPAFQDGYYPWNPATPAEQNKAIATIGQLKAVFSLRFEALIPPDSDEDGLADAWELANFGNLNQGANGDTDGDYISNVAEFQNGTDPDSATDGNLNGIPDDWELANTGKFSVYPPAITAELPRMQTASKPLYLWNDTDSVVNYSATVAGATVPAYSHKGSLTGGIAPSWVVGISATGTHLTTISDSDDNSEPATFTNFTFPFYGQVFSQVSVSSNGLLRFGSGNSSYQNRALPDPAAPHDIIAPFWDDLNPRKSGDIFFKQETDRFIAEFRDVAKHDDSGNLTFQVILFADGRIRFNYQILAGQTDECTVGIQGPDGNEGITVIHDSPYLQDTMTVEISPSSDFLEIRPAAGAVAARSVQPLAGLFRSFTLAPGIHPAAVKITHDSTASASPLEIPASLEVPDLPGAIVLTAPLDGGSVLQGVSVHLSADADDPDGIANVGFFQGETFIAAAATAPYGISTSTLLPGIYDITARLTDLYGQITVSAPRSFIVIADSDFDGMPDAWETANYLDPQNDSDAATDADEDGYTNLEESKFGKDPQLAEDTDGDLMPDGWEYHNGLNLTNNDAAADPDQDDLANLAEFQNGTNPFDPDADDDFMPDGWEVQNNGKTVIRSVGAVTATSAAPPEGATTSQAASVQLNPLDPADATLDPDEDGLTNLQEYLNGIRPDLDDTDGDGASDGAEVNSGANPNDGSDGGVPGGQGSGTVVVEIPFAIGGDYAWWEMTINGQGPTDTRNQKITSSKDAEKGYGQYEGETQMIKLHAGNKYRVTMKRMGGVEDEDGKWYCWSANVGEDPVTAALLPLETTFESLEHYQVGERIEDVAIAYAVNGENTDGGKATWLVDNKEGLFTRHIDDYESNVLQSLEAFLVPVEIIQPKLSETGGKITDENGVDEIEVVDTIRFCRWLDSFTGNTLKSDCADKDRDRFRIRIPAVLPNLTKIHIKSSGLLTAVIDGQWVSKSTDGDYDVTMTEENGAIVSKWMLLVSDGDDDVEYNGIGTDNGPNDQTLLADFNSPIEVTLPEYQNAKVTFHAQKPLGDLEIQPCYLSPAGDKPADMEGFITNHLEKMKEIYRQIGVRVGYYGIVGKAVPQAWFDAVPTPNQAANYFTPSESNLARAAVRGMAVPGKQIRIGFVNATVMQDGTSFNQVRVRGFTDRGTDGIIVSIEQNDARTILGVTAHEVGHALGLNHTSVQSWRRWLMRGDPGETTIWADEPLEHSKRFQSGDYEVIRNSQSFYVPYVPN